MASLDRRNFLLGSMAAVSMVSAAKSASAVSGKGIALERVFGKTGRSLPVLGHGGSALANNLGKDYGLSVPDRETRVAMVRHAYDLGVRFFDTARIYGDSESIMGEALRGVTDNVYLATKVMESDPAKVRPSVEESLKVLGVSRVDCAQLHGPIYERATFDEAMAIHAELAKLRDEGLFKYVGISGHNHFEKMHALLSTGGFDHLLIAKGYFKRGYNTIHSTVQTEWRELCLDKATELNMGVAAMKVFGANIHNHNARNLVPGLEEEEYARLSGACIRWILRDERIHVLNIGVTLPGDVAANIATLEQNLAYTSEDRALLAKYTQRAYETESVKRMEVV